MALRILWRLNEEATWKQIVSYRVACDKFIYNQEGVAFFVSVITGMKGKTAAKTLCINPGISYFIILDSAQVDPRAIVRNVTAAMQGQAEVKLLKEPPIIKEIESMHNTLCVVLKDHANGYIKQRIAASQEGLSDMSEPFAGPAGRLVVKSDNLGAFAKEAKETMEVLGGGSVVVNVVQY